MFTKLLAFLALCYSVLRTRLDGILLVFVAFVVLGLAAVGAWALTEEWDKAERVKETRVKDEEVENRG